MRRLTFASVVGVALLVLASIASAQGIGRTTILIHGERTLLTRSTPPFTFWVDRPDGEKYKRLLPDYQHVLIDHPQLSAPPGLKVETLSLGLDEHGRVRKSGRVQLHYFAYACKLQCALTPDPKLTPGAYTVTMRFPGILAARAALNAVTPEETPLTIPIEVYASPAAMVSARGPLMALHVALLTLGYALALWAAGCALRPLTLNRFAAAAIFALVIVTFLLVFSLMFELATLMFYVRDASLLLAIGAVVVFNGWAGVCIYSATGGFTDVKQPAHRLVCAGTTLAAALALYAKGHHSETLPMTPQLVGLVLACLVPGMLTGAARAQAGKPDIDHIAVKARQAIDSEKLRSAMQTLAVPMKSADTAPVREQLFHALEHAYAGRAEEAVAEINELMPVIDSLPDDDRPALRAAAHATHGIALETADLEKAAVDAYRRALDLVPDHELAQRAVARLTGVRSQDNPSR